LMPSTTWITQMHKPDPWFKTTVPSLEEFVFGMLTLGKPVETFLVGAFSDTGRGAQRDMGLVMHRDGEYDAQLAKDQGGMYVEHPGGVDIVGFYCLRDNPLCETLVKYSASAIVHSIVLKKGEALILDNRRVQHARSGPVGDRLLLRIWITEAQK